MKAQHFLLGVAAGFGAGYIVARVLEATRLVREDEQPRTPDAAEYGTLRRSLMLSGIVRSLAGSAALAYGPLGARLERSVERLPVWLRSAAFVAEVSLLDGLAELPVEFVEGYAVERRYGLSEQSRASWLADYAKQTALGMGVASVLSALLAAALRKFPNTWPYISSIGALPLLVFANVAVPLYVLPMFNTYEPLTGPLEERLRALAARYGVGQAEILRSNMSKQTKKANAFVIGIGNTHRIVVGDTLIEHFPEEEIEFVVAHELGHYVSKDTWRMIAAGEIAAMTVLFGAFFAERQSENDTRKLARIRAVGNAALTGAASCYLGIFAIARMGRRSTSPSKRRECRTRARPRSGGCANRIWPKTNSPRGTSSSLLRTRRSRLAFKHWKGRPSRHAPRSR